MSKKSENISLHSFIVGCLIIVGIWLGSIWLNIILFEGPHNDTAAWFGDSFGGINTLFSGLAFAGIIYTIILQRKELQLQREELAETRAELKRSADAQEKSQDALYQQKLALLFSAQLTGINNLIEYHQNITRNSVIGLREKDESRRQIIILKSKMEKILKEIETEFIM